MTEHLSVDGKEYIIIQDVSPEIYIASYPCWLFNYNKFINHLYQNYDLLEEFISFDIINEPSVFKGFIFVRTKS